MNEHPVLLLPVAALFVVTCFDSAQVGIRYLLPVLPLLFVWIGGLALLDKRSFLWRYALAAFFLFNLATALPVFPNYLSYFNPVATLLGGGWRYVRGSDVDWGQGLKALKRYMDKENVDEVVLRYFGPADPTFYGIRSVPLTEEEMKDPARKIYAISIFYLEHAEWTARIQPTATVGGSIFIYDFRQK